MGVLSPALAVDPGGTRQAQIEASGRLGRSVAPESLSSQTETHSKWECKAQHKAEFSAKTEKLGKEKTFLKLYLIFLFFFF